MARTFGSAEATLAYIPCVHKLTILRSLESVGASRRDERTRLRNWRPKKTHLVTCRRCDKGTQVCEIPHICEGHGAANARVGFADDRIWDDFFSECLSSSPPKRLIST